MSTSRAGIAGSMSAREARSISKEISRIQAPPISANRLQQLWDGADPTQEESAALQAWTAHCARDVQRIRDQNERLRWYLWRLAAAALAVATAVAVIYFATHAGHLMSQVSGI